MTSTWLGFLIAPPLVSLFVLSLTWWFDISLRERTTTRLVQGAFLIPGITSLCLLGQTRMRAVENYEAATWFSVGHYHSVWEFSLDPLALIMVALSCTLVVIIAVFSSNYLHQESGYTRFHLLMNLLGCGLLTILLAGNLEQIFFGWELVGLSSALLIGFYAHREQPVKNGFRAFLTYRLCDIGLLGAVVCLHHLRGSTSFVSSSHHNWFGIVVEEQRAFLILSLLLLACLGKSALFPVGGWLPRAMEGPTPSSAIFYGALSIHLGPYLLLRARPLMELSWEGSLLVVTVGLVTAFHASMVGRVQSDIKSSLAYASMTQVGLIVAEIGLGLEYVALLHIVCHACLRTLEILRAPSVLHDYHHIETSLGVVLPRMGLHYEKMASPQWRQRLYVLALQGGVAEPSMKRFLGWWTRFFCFLDRQEKSVEALFGSVTKDVGAATPKPLEVIK